MRAVKLSSLRLEGHFRLKFDPGESWPGVRYKLRVRVADVRLDVNGSFDLLDHFLLWRDLVVQC